MYQPTRRSRNIGKTQGGRVKDGRAQEKWSRLLGANVWRELSRADLPRWHVIRENPSRDFCHPCDEGDIHGVLRRLPGNLTEKIGPIVLRRTPKRDLVLGIDAAKRFSCIILNSFPRSNEMTWDTPPTDADRNHYAPWASEWIQRDRGWILRWTGDQVRRYYLFHLLLHEVGHVYDTTVTSSVRRREAFAENFALEWARKLLKPA